MGSVIKSHNKKLTNMEINCRRKEECLLEGKCRSGDIIYKCAASAIGHRQRAYLGTAEDEFKQRFYNHKKSFKNRHYATET